MFAIGNLLSSKIVKTLNLRLWSATCLYSNANIYKFYITLLNFGIRTSQNSYTWFKI